MSRTMWSLTTFPYRLLYNMGTILELSFSWYNTLYGHLHGCKSLFRETQNVLSKQKESTEKKTLCFNSFQGK